MGLAAAAERTSISAEVRAGLVERMLVTALLRLTGPLRYPTLAAAGEEAATMELLRSVVEGAGGRVLSSSGPATLD